MIADDDGSDLGPVFNVPLTGSDDENFDPIVALVREMDRLPAEKLHALGWAITTPDVLSREAQTIEAVVQSVRWFEDQLADAAATMKRIDRALQKPGRHRGVDEVVVRWRAAFSDVLRLATAVSASDTFDEGFARHSRTIASSIMALARADLALRNELDELESRRDTWPTELLRPLCEIHDGLPKHWNELALLVERDWQRVRDQIPWVERVAIVEEGGDTWLLGQGRSETKRSRKQDAMKAKRKVVAEHGARRERHSTRGSR